MEHHCRAGIALAASLLASSVAFSCVSTAGAAEGAHDASLPPPGRAQLVQIFRPFVAPLGLRVTRAALVDDDNRRSAAGTHLAVYVEPVSTYTREQYVEGLVTVTRAFLPRVFRRWDGLRSFDVCQEPLPSVDAGAEPSPETQVFVRRRGIRAVDWQHDDLAALLAAATRARREGAPLGLTVYVADHLRDVPAYAAAEANAGTAPQSSYR